MSNLQEIAARLMELSGHVPVGALQELQRAAMEAKQAQETTAMEVAQALGDSAVLDRLQANAGEFTSALDQVVAVVENVIPMAEGYRSVVQEEAAELLR
ncbi:hypothetical protein [Amycolatopsis echigonensis]|uniref:Uncharacterized protein n=1 Tax=Amycolatopsis echigonensis TaxID=2576905 RepID=A0A8E1W8T8_9PSEU|nr:hypothetical protein [Amycolatopsis echigonensis]MBB2506001.1 hypothetical protein [Amycolatopsis echigonensis]